MLSSELYLYGLWWRCETTPAIKAPEKEAEDKRQRVTLHSGYRYQPRNSLEKMLVTKNKLIQAGRKVWQHQRYHGCERSVLQCLVADSPVSALRLCTQIRCKQPHCMPAPAPVSAELSWDGLCLGSGTLLSQGTLIPWIIDIACGNDQPSQTYGFRNRLSYPHPVSVELLPNAFALQMAGNAFKQIIQPVILA